MEDDEDLEFLRLAALKSINSKKEIVPATKLPNGNDINHLIPVVSNVRPPAAVNSFYSATESELVQPNLIHHPVPYLKTGFDKINLNEPYIPQRLNPSNAHSTFTEYIPSSFTASANIESTNVQLSPRSAAFVLENNKQINKRRRGSPAHSPILHRKSPGRWSRSPSQESWKYHRSTSHSPVYQNASPHFRDRSISRSPQRRRYSPNTFTRKTRSRSPILRNPHDGIAHRMERRSPNVQTARRNYSPYRDGKNWQPKQQQQQEQPHRKRSPVAESIRRRSTSRSPNRKYNGKISVNTRRGGRKMSPSKRFNRSNNSQRNRNFNTARRPNSPSQKRHTKSRSPLNNHRRKTPTQNGSNETAATRNNEQKIKEQERNDASIRIEESNTAATTKSGANTSDAKDGIDEKLENELLASSGDENSDSDDNDSDGIDLFASEESESENEGRFKLSSSKSERKTHVPAVSFSELGKPNAAAVLRDLDELQTESNVASSKRGGSRRDNSRNNSSRSNNNNSRHDNRRYGSSRKFSEREHNRSRDRPRDSNKKSNEENRKHETESDGMNARSERKSILFKPTFTAVESERTKSPEGGNFQFKSFVLVTLFVF